MSQLADGQIHSLSELQAQLIIDLKLSPEEVKERTSSGRQTVFSNRAGWARTYMAKAGLIETPSKANYRITERGQKALTDCPDKISNQYLKQYPEFLEFVRPKKTDKDEPDADAVESDTTPDEQIESAYQSLTQSLASDLLSSLKSGSFIFFEKVVVDLMLAMGYGGSRKDAGQATQATNDDGIDGIIKEDRLGLDVIYLQAKKWEKTIHRPEIDKFIGTLTRQRARKGVFITTSAFSDGALEAVNNLDMKVVLIDGQHLAELMIEHNLGVTRKEIYEVKQIDSDYFSEDN